MKIRFLLALFATLLALPALAADLTGVWTGHLTDPMGNKHDISLRLKVAGDSVTGTLTGGPPSGEEQSLVNGKLQGDQLSFDVKTQGPGGGTLVLTYKGTIAGNRIQGSQESPMGALPWEVTKQ